jgi:hypothetical protein
VHLKPDELGWIQISTTCFPSLSVLRNGQWVPARSRTAPSAPDVARIFDARAIPAENPPNSPGIFPLYANHPEFSQTRYWRLPDTAFGGILSALMMRAMAIPPSAEGELRLARALFCTLSLQRDVPEIPSVPIGGGSAGPSGDGAAGPSDGGSARRRSPRKRGAKDRSPKQRSKRRRVTGAGSRGLSTSSCSILRAFLLITLRIRCR